MEREYEVTKDRRLVTAIKECRRTELSVWAKSDVVLYFSAEECATARAAFDEDKKAIEIPLFVYRESEIARARGLIQNVSSADPYHLMFVGGFNHGPNVDGVLWFVREVWPKVRAEQAHFRFTVVGSNPPPSILDLAAPDVEVTGLISDERLAELYATAGAVVVPLRFGAGVKGKVIEAFANAIPVVTTWVGMQGIDDAEQVAFVADDPDELARCILRVAVDRSIAQLRAAAAVDFLERRYSTAAAVELLSLEIPELRWSAP